MPTTRTRNTESITEAAAILYRHGTQLKAAVDGALDQYNISDPFERPVLFKEICSRLGKRGNQRKKTLKAIGVLPKKPKQLSFRFIQPSTR